MPLIAATLMLSSTAGAQAPVTAENVARRLQQHYQKLTDFQAQFVHTVRGGQLRKQVRTSEGRLYVKKPGRIRWEYRKPERQEGYWDGRTFHLYFPDANEVHTTSQPSDGGATTSLRFLTGEGDILKDFIVSLAPSASSDQVALKLTPRREEADFEQITVVLDAKSMRLRSLTTRDHLGGEGQYDFRDLRENTGLSDQLFVFKPPAGVQVSEFKP
jgi:outer membrane lipoprotein carrier protein